MINRLVKGKVSVFEEKAEEGGREKAVGEKRENGGKEEGKSEREDGRERKKRKGEEKSARERMLICGGPGKTQSFSSGFGIWRKQISGFRKDFFSFHRKRIFFSFFFFWGGRRMNRKVAGK